MFTLKPKSDLIFKMLFSQNVYTGAHSSILVFMQNVKRTVLTPLISDLTPQSDLNQISCNIKTKIKSNRKSKVCPYILTMKKVHLSQICYANKFELLVWTSAGSSWGRFLRHFKGLKNCHINHR